jgi:signal transduction histidine kinase
LISSQKLQRVKGFKEIIYVTMVTVLVNLVFSLIGPYKEPVSAAFFAGALILLFFSLLLDFKGLTISAKLLASIVLNALIGMVSYRVGLQSGSVLYYFPFIVSFVYLFRSSNEPRLVYLFFGITAVSMFLILFLIPMHPEQLDIPDETIHKMLFISFTTSFLLTAYLCFALFRYQQSLYEARIREQKEHKLEIMRSVLYAQEEDRSILAENLQNNINQNLASGKMLLQSLSEQHVYNGLLEKSLNVTESVMQDLNTICHNLNAGIVKDLGLEEGLHDYIANYSNTHPVSVDLNGNFSEAEQLPLQDRLFIFRMIQDYLMIHATNKETQLISIQFAYSKQQLDLHFVQNDEEFSLDRSGSQLLLKDLYNRVEFYQGQLTELTSEQGRETHLILRLN